MGPCVVVFAGEYSVSVKSRLRSEMSRISTKPEVVLDFTEVTFIDSICVTELLRMQKRRSAAEYPRASIVINTPSLKRLFTVLNLDRVFNVVETLDDALPRNGETSQIEYAFSGDGGIAAPDDFVSVVAGRI